MDKLMKEHIVSTYDEDLNSLKSNLVEMGVSVNDNFSML